MNYNDNWVYVITDDDIKDNSILVVLKIKEKDRGLIIEEKWIEKILSGEKTWEIRKRKTNIRGTISLIKEGKIYGKVKILDCKKMTKGEILDPNSIKKHCVEDINGFKDYGKRTYFYVLIVEKVETTDGVHKGYIHPKGAQEWVVLDGRYI